MRGSLRLKKQARQSKPFGASTYHWAYFECYDQAHLNMYAVSKLCWEQQERDRAEIKYSQSPTKHRVPWPPRCLQRLSGQQKRGIVAGD